MSSACPSAGVSTTTGAPASLTTAASCSASIMPVAMLACRSRDDANSSRELFRCTRSMRPVMALTRSTMPTRSSPAANAWQVSRQKPAPNSPTSSHSRASMSNRRAMALSPPAVFSMRTGSGKPPASACRSKNLRQFTSPAAGSSPCVTWPPCTIRPFAPVLAADSAYWVTVLRDGIRMRLFVEAMFTGYGECTNTSMPASRSASACGCGGCAFQLCGSPRKNCTTSAFRSRAAPRGSSLWMWAPMLMARERSRPGRHKGEVSGLPHPCGRLRRMAESTSARPRSRLVTVTNPGYRR